MTEMIKIVLVCLVQSGQVYWLVLMDTQKKSMVIIVLLGVTNMTVSKLQPLSFME